MKNQYEGKTAKDIWKEWNSGQRYHFLRDHIESVFGRSIDDVSDTEYEKIIGWTRAPIYDFLPDNVKNIVDKHISEGQYKKGGTPGKKYGVYVYGKLQDSYSDELIAGAAKHSLQAIHPTWKIEVKPLKKSEYKQGGIINFLEYEFNPHTKHNPYADILAGKIDNDTEITYGIYVKGKDAGEEFMEYYAGENYVVGSNKRSKSNMWKPQEIPAKYKNAWESLKQKYETEYKNNPAMYESGGIIDFSFLTQKVSFTELFTK